MAPKIELTEKQWVEVFYAIEYKLTSPAMYREWRKELKEIQEPIQAEIIT